MTQAASAVSKKAPTFCFSPENLKRANTILSYYPKGRQRSAVLPLLDLAQRQQGGWLPRDVLDYVADFLSVPRIKVYEVATFYTMFNLKPVGKHFIQVCRTTPCWLKGADNLTHACKRKLGIGLGDTTSDGMFTVTEVECLGACVNAPMVQINDDYYEDLTPETMEAIIDELRAGRVVKKGTQVSRLNSAPVSGLTTLQDSNT